MKTTIIFVLGAFLIILGSAKSDSLRCVFTQTSVRSDPNYMAARLKSAGFQVSDIQVIGPDLQHKNLVLRFRGNGKLKPVLFICHLDVVEALREDWSVDPFTFLWQR